MDLRTRVAAALEGGDTVRAAARRFGISVASAVRIGQQQKSGRGQVPRKIGGHRLTVLAGETGSGLLTRLTSRPVYFHSDRVIDCFTGSRMITGLA